MPPLDACPSIEQRATDGHDSPDCQMAPNESQKQVTAFRKYHWTKKKSQSEENMSQRRVFFFLFFFVLNGNSPGAFNTSIHQQSL